MQIALRQITMILFATVLTGGSVTSAEDRKSSSRKSAKEAVKVLAEVEIPRNGSDLITVPIALKNGTYRFLLDMACSTTVYDVALRDILGEPVGKTVAKGIDGVTATVEFFRWPVAKIGRLRMKAGSFVGCMDLESLRKIQRLTVYGILGMDFLRRHVIRLDFDRGKLTILSKAPADSGKPIPIHYLPDQRPTITVKLPGKLESPCLLGSALFATILLHPDRFDKFASQGHLRASKGKLELASAFGPFYKKGGRLDRLTVGEFTHRKVGVIGGAILEKYDAIGLNFFARHLVTLDFPNKVLYLKKGAGFDRREYDNLSGLHPALNLKKDQWFVHKVIDGSAAKSAGFLSGDVILLINGQDVRKYSIYRLRYLLCNPGKVTMTVKRGNKKISLSMVLTLSMVHKGESAKKK